MTAMLLPAKDAARSEEPGRRIPGEVGVWVFIFGDMTIFAVMFATYLQGRSRDTEIFDRSQLALNQDFGVANTVLLLVSSLLVVMAVRAVRERRGRAEFLLLGAVTCGVAFSALKVVEYVDKTQHQVTPATNDFFMYYFMLTGLHWVHLLIGMGLLGVLVWLARKPTLSDGQLAFFEGGACFWHMVDLLWIVLFPLLYLVH
ncbi:cytochrome c oxidase subunit 3 [Nocardioides sp. GCM10030258]|uniref:cytochrome c oxidase subunit 3 n=1 Tax=unclassified Nocardioides TaxID=2615069 RepID=UPI00361F34CA